MCAFNLDKVFASWHYVPCTLLCRERRSTSSRPQKTKPQGGTAQRRRRWRKQDLRTDSGEGEAWWWFGLLATIKATGEQTGGRYSLVEILAPDGYEAVLHVHHQEDEGFYILEGEMTFYVGDQTIKARPGSFLFGPKDVPIPLGVDSGPAKLLFVFTPAGFEGLIRETGEPARSLIVPPQLDEEPDEVEMERMAVIDARYGTETLGPLPNQ